MTNGTDDQGVDRETLHSCGLIVPRSLEEEEDAHEVSWKPFIGTLWVKARPGEPDQHLEASLARRRETNA